MKKIFYRPETGYTCDIIPFVENDELTLYYLHDYRDIMHHSEGTPWMSLKTDDFIDYENKGEAISRGTEKDQDLFIFTGSALKVDDTYHIFYTGHNPHFSGALKPQEAIMHAISSDGIHYKKLPDECFFADSKNYAPDDFRDPFVFYDEDLKSYRMLLAARRLSNNIRSGVTAEARSTDLKNWTMVEDFYAPNEFFTHECPDYFKEGNYEYLLFSEFSSDRVTKYRYRKIGQKHWRAFKNDSFDGRAFYAAKSAVVKGHRYIFGWNPTKDDDDDYKNWNWGGNLVVHEITQIPDGHLKVTMPQSYAKFFNSGKKEAYPNISFDKMGQCSIQKLKVPQKSSYKLSFDFILDDVNTTFGVMLRYDEVSDFGYIYKFSEHELVFDLFPNKPWQYADFVGVKQDIQLLKNKKYHVDIVCEDDICILYFNNEIALNSRMYQNRNCPPAFRVSNGCCNVTDIRVSYPHEE